MSQNDLENRLVRVLREQCRSPRNTIAMKPETRFREDLDCDSLDEVEILMALEEEFSMTIPDGDAEKIKTVGEALAYLAHRVTESV